MGRNTEYKVLIYVEDENTVLWNELSEKQKKDFRKKMIKRLENTLSRYYSSQSEEYKKMR